MFSIANEAFDGTAYYNDTSNWENDILYIGAHLIDSKYSLTSANVRPGTINIASFAFSSKLASVTLPDSLLSIGSYAFSGTSISNIAIPSSVTKIGSAAFNNCKSLMSIKIPNGITLIDNNTFSGCTSLKSITIPKSVTKINYGAFGYVTPTAVYYSGTEADWGNISFYSSDTTILNFKKASRYYITGQEIIGTSYANGILTVDISTTNGENDAIIYAAVYDKNGKLKGSDFVTQNIATANTTSLEISCVNESGDYVQTFIFDKEYAPICDIARAYV